MRHLILMLLFVVDLSAQQIFTQSVLVKNIEPSVICNIFAQPSLYHNSNGYTIAQIAPNFNPMKMPEGILTCVGLDNLSAIFIQAASEEAIQDMKRLISLFDVAPKQIEIKVKMLTLSSASMKKMQLAWQKSLFATSVSGILGPEIQNGIEYKSSKGNLLTALKGLNQTNDSKTITEQSLIVMNSVPGYISFSQQIPVWMNGSVSIWPSGITIQSNTIAFASIVVGLNVQAYVVGDSIELVLAPQIQEVLGYTQGYGGQRVPMVSNFDLYTKVRVKNGEDLIIGGLTRNSDKIGWFSQIKENTESLLSVSARILPE